MFPFFIKKNIFTNYCRVLYNIYRNKKISNSNSKAEKFFEKIDLYKELKLTQDNWRANFEDLQFLYELILNKKISTILEFGTGFSTIVMAAALKFNSKHKKNNKIYTLETEKKWIVPVKKKLMKYKKYSEIIHSKCDVQLIDMSLCSVYRRLPNIIPDLIYLDGPDPDSVKSKIFNLNYEKTNNPVSADILLYEYRLKPGAIIVVDGRPNNVIFLKNHLKRKYKFQFQRLYSRSIFELQE
jgi:predicted O-methyltransferase YrrM